jgi:hypothetical protein
VTSLRKWGDNPTVAGPQGIQGLQGLTGPQGPQGEDGLATPDGDRFKSLSGVAAGATFANKINNSEVVKGGTYFVVWVIRYIGSNPNTEAEFRVEIDGVEIDLLSEGSVGDSDNHLTWSSFDLVVLPEDATVDFKLQYRQPSSPGTLTVSHAKIAYVRVLPTAPIPG